MRFAPFLCVLFPLGSMACTAFKVTQDGRTIVGFNEDAWSINAQVRFEQGRDGGYGAIYFAHFNGHPMRAMNDQMGMNEAGLVFDGLSIPRKEVPATAWLKMHFNALMPHVLRTCANVQEAAALLRTYDLSLIPGAMIFLADKHGGYLIVENDTIIEDHDPWYAVGNWRMGNCSDPDAIPIPRLQAGRALLGERPDASVERGTAVLESMKACRSKMGEGTLFSTLFDLERGEAHLFFYHDFSERISFHLKDELAKGDRTIDMATLFGERPEYDRLKGYITPFHQRWLFWFMVGMALVAGIAGLLGAIQLVQGLLARARGRNTSLAVPLLLGTLGLLVIMLSAVLLLNEGVYYFGLGDLLPALAFLPMAFIALAMAMLIAAWRQRVVRRWPLVIGALTTLPMTALLGYWGMWWS